MIQPHSSRLLRISFLIARPFQGTSMKNPTQSPAVPSSSTLPISSSLPCPFFHLLLYVASAMAFGHHLFSLLVYDQAHKKGFRSSTAQSWSLGKAFGDIFSCTTTKTTPDSSLTAFAASTAQPTLSQNIYFMAPQEEFSSPLYREILYSSKMATNNNATIARILEEGHSCLIPTTDDPSAIDPDLLELACISGASLVPVYGYGDASAFQAPNAVDNLMSAFMTLPSIYGKDSRPSVAQPFPNKTPLDVIVGVPIHPIVGELAQAVSQLQNLYTAGAAALRLKRKIT
ncbi:hypothetical protein DSO57_1037910, partial [Entomophthora muscae]